MTGHSCKVCGRKLIFDEIALHQKMFGKTAKEYMCLDCQAAYLNVNRGCLEKLIGWYHKSGTCSLFAKIG